MTDFRQAGTIEKVKTDPWLTLPPTFNLELPSKMLNKLTHFTMVFRYHQPFPEDVNFGSLTILSLLGRRNAQAVYNPYVRWVLHPLRL